MSYRGRHGEARVNQHVSAVPQLLQSFHGDLTLIIHVAEDANSVKLGGGGSNDLVDGLVNVHYADGGAQVISTSVRNNGNWQFGSIFPSQHAVDHLVDSAVSSY